MAISFPGGLTWDEFVAWRRAYLAWHCRVTGRTVTEPYLFLGERFL